MKIKMGCYYFPNYHVGDARNIAVHGNTWTEWELVKAAIPRFPGHIQPRVPLWGYGDEKSPEVMNRKINAAADAGISFFIFDWYYYNDGSFLNRALDEGFLNATDRSRLKFCLMWANHDWVDIHPATPEKAPLLYPGGVTPETFQKICQLSIERYFLRPEYFRVDGKPYFSIYELGRFVSSFGSVAAARQALENFREACVKAGMPGLHLNAVIWGAPILPNETVPKNAAVLAEELGFDSMTSYVWVHHAFPQVPFVEYGDVLNSYLAFWNKTLSESKLEYFPNLSVGWDTTPRTRANYPWDGTQTYPYGGIIRNNTPKAFAEACKIIRQQMEKLSATHPILTINSWNEWTEGSYLEPDTHYGTAYLDALHEYLT